MVTHARRDANTAKHTTVRCGVVPYTPIAQEISNQHVTAAVANRQCRNRRSGRDTALVFAFRKTS